MYLYVQQLSRDLLAKNMIKSFLNNKIGSTAVEYAMVICGVAPILYMIFGDNGIFAKMMVELYSKLVDLFII